MRKLLVLFLFVATMLPMAAANIPDPGHPASDIGPGSNGTFSFGDFVFPQDLNITRNLSVEGNLSAPLVFTSQLCLGGVCQTSWPYPLGNVSSEGVANYVPLFTNATTIGNSVIYQNGTRIGINTTNPQAALEVAGTALVYGLSVIGPGPSLGFLSPSTSASALVLTEALGALVLDGATGVGVRTLTPAYVLDVNGTFRTRNAAYLATDSGFVGINTTSPNQLLDVRGNANISGVVYTPQLCLNGDCRTSWPSGAGGNITGSGVANYVARFTNSSNVATGVLYDNGTAVGIGNTAPNATLEVTGTGRFSSTLTASSGFTLSGGTLTLPTDSITSAFILDGAVGTSDLANSAVTNAKIGNAAINASKLNTTNTGSSGQFLALNSTGQFTWTTGSTGSVTSVAVARAGTTAVSVSGSPITSSGTITITFQNATAAQDGLLRSADFTTFNNKAGTGTASCPAGQVVMNVTTTTGAPTVQCVALATGSMSSWTIAGTSGTPQTVSDGETATIAAGTGITTTAAATRTVTVGLTGQALALHNLGSNGIIARTGAGTVAARTITGGTGITVTNGNGVSGNPTIAINNTGVSAATYGNASHVGTFTVDAQGRLTSASNTAIAIDAGAIVSGTIASARISGSYTGITGVGTIAAGTWQGTAITDTYVADAITVSGGTIGSNTISSGATWTTAGTLTIGDGGDAININSSTWDVQNGAVSGVTTIAASGAITLGGDAAISRGAANRFDIASGDSLNLVSGSILIAGTTVIDSSRNYNGGTGTFSGALSATTLDTGQGANELYAMNQNVRTTDAVTFATINTGSGAMELGDAAITNGDTNSIPTNDQVYDFVIGLGYGTGSGNITGSGSAGHVPYWTSGSDIGFDSGQFYWDATNNRLGIGTSSPSQALSVTGSINVSANVFYGGNLTGYGADFAEKLNVLDDAKPGDVVCLAGGFTVRKCDRYADTRVAGVLSTHATIIGNEAGAPNGKPVGIVGILPTNVIGPVAIGDVLTTSDKPGYAERGRGIETGAILGKAMDSCDGGECTVRVLVTLR